MNPPAINSRVFEFSFPQFDTLVQVEEADGVVVIRTTRDTFSEERKACFVRELAAEGFISEELRWLPGSLSGASRAVRWLVDRSSFMPSQALATQTRRIMVRLLGATALFWVVLMAFLFLHNHG